jgi:uncharacterized membrane protein
MESILDQPQSSGSKKSIDDVLQNGYNISIGDAWSRATEIWKKNIGGFLLYTILGPIIMLIAACVPVIGIIADIFVLGPAFIAGYYLVASKLITGNVTNKDYSSGFKKNGDNAKYMMLMVLAYLVVYSPILIYFLMNYKTMMGAIAEAKSESNIMAVNYISSSFSGIMWYVRGLSLVFGIASLFLVLVLPLINLYGLDAMTAIKTSIKVVSKNFWSFFLVALVAALINICGVLFCGIGLFFTISLAYCFYFAVYEQIFESPADSVN